MRSIRFPWKLLQPPQSESVYLVAFKSSVFFPLFFCSITFVAHFFHDKKSPLHYAVWLSLVRISIHSQNTKFILIITILEVTRTAQCRIYSFVHFYFSFVFNSILLHVKLLYVFFFIQLISVKKMELDTSSTFRRACERDKIDRLFFGWSE